MQQQRNKAKVILLNILFGVIFTLGVSIFVVCAWYAMTYDLEFKELL